MNSVTETLKGLVDRLRAMSPEEFKQSLIRTDIIDEYGNLMPHYRQPEKKPRRKPKNTV